MIETASVLGLVIQRERQNHQKNTFIMKRDVLLVTVTNAFLSSIVVSGLFLTDDDKHVD